MTKICRICKQDKPLEEFTRDKRAPGGKRHECNECKRAYIRRYNETRARLAAAKAVTA